MEEKHFCHEDGAEMVRGYRPITFTYKGIATTVDMPGWYCVKCGEGVHSARDSKVSDRALNAAKAKVEGLLESKEIKRIRKKLKLTQAEAGQIVGGGPKAFTKYENGDALTSRAATNLLRVLDAMPEAMGLLVSRFNRGARA